MKDIRIVRLTLDNFKGQRHFSLEPNGAGCTVYGDNAAGKSTLYDALTWLLFGKDSRGQSGFEIKPLGPDGAVLDHEAVTSVEAALTAGGEDITLKKTYYEVWSTRRGSTQASFDGNSSDYYIDGVPVKKYEFDCRVCGLADEGLFRALTSVTWFCGELDWRRRRDALFDLGQMAEDSEIMSANPAFAPLAAAMGRLTLDEFKKKLQAERKGYVGVRNDLPVRLDECRKTAEELETIDFVALESERASLAGHRDALASDLQKLSGNTLLDARRNERGRLMNELTALEQENAGHRKSQERPMADTAGLRVQAKALEGSLLRLMDERRQELKLAAACDASVAEYREKWNGINAETFGGADCPTCGHPLEGAGLREAESRFYADKQKRLDRSVQEAQTVKERGADHRRRAESATEAAVGLENQIAELADKLALAEQREQPQIQDLPGYASRREELAKAVAQLDGEIAQLSKEGSAVRDEIQNKIQALTEELEAIGGAIAKKGALEFTRERMDQLRTEAAAAAAKLERLDKLLFLAEDFMRYKVKAIEAGINSRFSVVQWKLFSEQVNGGLSECCEATVGGVPYGSLNSGMRINAGIDVIAALSAHHGVQVPLVVDNAETVTALRRTDAQMIRLVVSAGDKELRCEYGT